jgi:hypothetical protein
METENDKLMKVYRQEEKKVFRQDTGWENL